jgi:hypothetical protein
LAEQTAQCPDKFESRTATLAAWRPPLQLSDEKKARHCALFQGGFRSPGDKKMVDRHFGRGRSSRPMRSRRRRSSRRLRIGAWLLAIGSFLVIALLIGVAVYTVSKHGLGSATESPTAITPTGNRLTLENFRRLRYGMSYGQVVAIMGPPQFDETDKRAQVKSRNLGWNNGRDTVSVQFFGDANKANVVCATFDRVNYNAPKP